MNADTCPHGVEQPLAGPTAARCAYCLDRHPVVAAGHLVFADDHGGIVWLPLQLVTLVRVASDDQGAGYVDVSVVQPGHPGLELEAGTTDAWHRVLAADPHGVAVAIAAGRWR